MPDNSTERDGMFSPLLYGDTNRATPWKIKPLNRIRDRGAKPSFLRGQLELFCYLQPLFSSFSD